MSSTDKTKLDGIATNANNYTHPTSGVTAGTYRSVTVNAQGHITAGTNPTTLAGYGITDAAPSSHTHSYLPLSGGTCTGEVINTSANAYRMVNGNYGVITRNDGSNYYVLLTASGDQYGSWNTLRPLSINLASGVVAFGNGLSGSLTGNASTATALQTARTIALGGDFTGSKSFDGTGNITITGTLANSGVTAGTYRSVTVDAKGRVTAGTNPTTLAGYGITDAVKTQSSINFGGSATAITTDDFITQLTNLGAFNSMYWCTKALWSYAGNNYITDTGVGTIQLAGCTVEVIGGSASTYTVRIHTAPTVSISGAVPNADFVYVNHGSGYSPKWHKIYNTDNKPTAVDVGALPLTGGTVSGQVYNSVTGVPNTFVGGKISSEIGTISLDAISYAFVTSPLDAHLCFNSRYQPSVGWVKYDNNRPSGKIVINEGSGLQYVRSDSGSANPNQYQYDIWHSGNFNPASKSDVGHTHSDVVWKGTGVTNLSINLANGLYAVTYYIGDGGRFSCVTMLSVDRSIATICRGAGYSSDWSGVTYDTNNKTLTATGTHSTREIQKIVKLA